MNIINPKDPPFLNNPEVQKDFRPIIPEPKKCGLEPHIIHYSSHRFHTVIKFRRVVDTLYTLNPKDTPELVRRKLHEIMIYEAFNT